MNLRMLALAGLAAVMLAAPANAAQAPRAAAKKAYPLEKSPVSFPALLPLPDGIATADFTVVTGDERTESGLQVYLAHGEVGLSQAFASCREARTEPATAPELARAFCDGREFRLVSARGAVEVRERKGAKDRTVARLPVPKGLAVQSWEATSKKIRREPRPLDPEPQIQESFVAAPPGVALASFGLDTGGDQMGSPRQVGLAVSVVYGKTAVRQRFASCDDAGHGNALCEQDDLDAANCDQRFFHLVERAGAIEVVEELEAGRKTIVRIPLPEKLGLRVQPASP